MFTLEELTNISSLKVTAILVKKNRGIPRFYDISRNATRRSKDAGEAAGRVDSEVPRCWGRYLFGISVFVNFCTDFSEPVILNILGLLSIAAAILLDPATDHVF